MIRIMALLTVVLCWPFALFATTAVPRLALVIGNGGYLHTTPLVNTTNDAQDISKDLQAMGFEVMLVENANLDQTIDAVDRFTQRLHATGGVGLLYYSGHGVQVGGENYIVPIDAKLKSPSRVPYEAFALNSALDRMGGREAGAINLVILDACRDNPFSARTRGGSKGLARVSAPESTLILYATRPGETASDNPEGRNGLFTQYLRTAIKQPGVDVEKSFSDVVKAVYKASEGAQYPWKEGVLLSDFSFTPKAKLQAEVEPPVVRPPSPDVSTTLSSAAGPVSCGDLLTHSSPISCLFAGNKNPPRQAVAKRSLNACSNQLNTESSIECLFNR